MLHENIFSASAFFFLMHVTKLKNILVHIEDLVHENARKEDEMYKHTRSKNMIMPDGFFMFSIEKPDDFLIFSIEIQNKLHVFN